MYTYTYIYVMCIYNIYIFHIVIVTTDIVVEFVNIVNIFKI